MKHFLIIILILLTATSCRNKKPDFYLVVSQLNRNRINNKMIEPNLFYYKHNFILTEDKIYYYRNNKFTDHCDNSCMDFSKPEFLRLMPADIKQINNDSLTSLLDAIKCKYMMVTIASEFDTIKNKALSIFLDFINTTKKDSLHFGYAYRLMTEEESVVLNAKLGNLAYNPDSVKWKNQFGGAIINESLKNN